MLGAMITHWDPEDYTGRASVKLHTVEELRLEGSTLQPRGFQFEPPGIIRADTSVRRVLSDNAMSFVKEGYSNLGAKEIDITDFVLFGVQHGGASLINYTAVKEEGAPPVLLPFSNYRVSNSSFNIYGPCKMPDGTYRTHSLLELEDGSGKEFYCVFPEDVDLSWAASMCKMEGDLMVNDTLMTIYHVQSCLKPFYTCVGEAFLNYLAYSVAFYSVGRKLLREVSPAIPGDTTQEKSPVTAEKRYPRRNVSIEHVYDKLCLSGINACGGDNEKLVAYLTDYPESRVTMHWLQKLFNSPWFNSAEGSEEDRARTACVNLMVECKENGLKYGLELLTHRYYLSVIDQFEDFIPIVLKGGGVDGESLKRVSLK